MGELDILSYGISMTTLEEVFLKANGDHDEMPKVETQANDDDERYLLKGNRDTRGSSINRNENEQEEGADNKDKDKFGDGSLHELENQQATENLVG